MGSKWHTVAKFCLDKISGKNKGGPLHFMGHLYEPNGTKRSAIDTTLRNEREIFVLFGSVGGYHRSGENFVDVCLGYTFIFTRVAATSEGDFETVVAWSPARENTFLKQKFDLKKLENKHLMISKHMIDVIASTHIKETDRVVYLLR
uniref:Uncharacterized protein n=1 Tax=Romanomermis culicivorax TaxID=13658 RepID=A0A915IGD4_ROMCU